MELLNAQNIECSNSLNQYSFDLYNETKVENENLFISPLSTYYALLSACEGSKNKTKEEFENVLYLKDSAFTNSDYPNNFALKTDRLAGLKISNAVWVDKRFQVEAGFENAVSSTYFSDFKQIEFVKTAQAVSDINRWVSDKTNQRITNMVSLSDINAETKLMISNAVYFKGEWLKKFEKIRTKESTFFTDEENQYKVDFMNVTEKLNYFENDAFQFVAKPYKDSELSFCIMLPKAIVFMGRYVTPEDGKMIDKADFENNIEKRVLENFGWNSGKEPLVILTDGKKMKEVDIQDVNFKNVIDFKVYTKKEDIEKYTTKAYYGIGVVVFTVKKIKKGTK